MKFTSTAKALAALVTALALSTVGLAVVVPRADAHTPGATATCTTLDVNLKDYQKGSPGSPATANHVTVNVNGAVQAGGDLDFETGWVKSFTVKAGDTYEVVVKAWDDPTGHEGWTTTITGTIAACAPVAAAMKLTYMTACAPDDTNTWRIRNGSTFPVKFTLEYAGQPGLVAQNIAPVGDSFLDTPRFSATAILRWGGGDSGIIAGSATEASGNDEISAGCAGDKPVDKVITKDVGVPDCGATTIKTETTTTGYIREGNGWVLDVDHAVVTYGTRTLTSEEMVLFQNTNPDGVCYKVSPTKDATTVVTEAKWGCGDLITKTASVTTTYTFEFHSVNGSYGPPVAHVGEPVVGSRDLSTDEILLYQNTNPDGSCYVKPRTMNLTLTKTVIPALTKTVIPDGPYYSAGEQVTYQLAPHNAGPGNALAGWSVTDILPVGMTLVSISGVSGDGYTCETTRLTCTSSHALAADATGSPITVVAQIPDDAKPGTLTNVAYVSPATGDVPETNTTDNGAQAAITVAEAKDVVITLSPQVEGVVITLPNTGTTIPLTWLLGAIGIVAAGVILLGASRFNARGRKI